MKDDNHLGGFPPHVCIPVEVEEEPKGKKKPVKAEETEDDGA